MQGVYIQGKFVCPIKGKTFPYRHFIHSTLKENLKKYGRKTYLDTLRSVDKGCYFIKKRWHFDCGKEELERCLFFLKGILPALKVENIYPPAYLEGAIVKTINERGEEFFKKTEGD